jgi:hypothetical protein
VSMLASLPSRYSRPGVIARIVQSPAHGLQKSAAVMFISPVYYFVTLTCGQSTNMPLSPREFAVLTLGTKYGPYRILTAFAPATVVCAFAATICDGLFSSDGSRPNPSGEVLAMKSAHTGMSYYSRWTSSNPLFSQEQFCWRPYSVQKP